MLLNITTLPGDGIGPEVLAEAVRVLDAVAKRFGHTLTITEKPIGGAALAATNGPLPPDTLAACLSSSAVLLGAVGSPAYDNYPRHLRPEAGLLRLRRERAKSKPIRATRSTSPSVYRMVFKATWPSSVGSMWRGSPK